MYRLPAPLDFPDLTLSSLSDDAALSLAEALLEEDEDARRTQFAALLERDAAFAQWTRERASHRPAETPAELTAWLCRHALDVLDGPEATSATAPPSRGSKVLQQLVARLRRQRSLEEDYQRTLETEKLASLKELAYGASHEINNPLANISTRAQTLLRDETAPERRKMLAVINSQAFRAHEMISDMMLFARPPAIEPQRVDLVDVVREVCQELAPMAAEQATALLPTDLPSDRFVVSADGAQLGVALKALVQNSLEAVGAGGQVEIALTGPHASSAANGDLHEATPTFHLIVTDNGPGISPEVRRHLFDPFYSGREAGRGLGFGLSKCWRILTSHGGRVEVDSEHGHGATFTLIVPAVAGDDQGKSKKAKGKSEDKAAKPLAS